MADSDEDDDSKTEEPSRKKLDDALEKGQVISSREVMNAFVICVLTVMIIWILPIMLFNFGAKLRIIIESAGLMLLDQGQIWNVSRAIFDFAFIALSPVFASVILAVIIANFIQHGQLTFSAESIQPKLSKISILAGFKRIFSTKSFVEFLKNIAKVTLVGMFLYLIVSSDIKGLKVYQDMSISLLLMQYHKIISDVMICICVTAIALAIIDYSYQRYEYFKSMRMTKQEVKDEYRQSEGDAQVKHSIRQKRQKQIKQNISVNVPKATVIITNPTHYAVALMYDEATMPAPQVIAKGLDDIALIIREIAEEHNIPIVENPPLARALHAKVKEKAYIPVEHYETVAQIIGYVYSKNTKKR